MPFVTDLTDRERTNFAQQAMNYASLLTDFARHIGRRQDTEAVVLYLRLAMTSPFPRGMRDVFLDALAGPRPAEPQGETESRPQGEPVAAETSGDREGTIRQ